MRRFPLTALLLTGTLACPLPAAAEPSGAQTWLALARAQARTDHWTSARADLRLARRADPSLHVPQPPDAAWQSAAGSSTAQLALIADVLLEHPGERRAMARQRELYAHLSPGNAAPLSPGNAAPLSPGRAHATPTAMLTGVLTVTPVLTPPAGGTRRLPPAAPAAHGETLIPAWPAALGLLTLLAFGAARTRRRAVRADSASTARARLTADQQRQRNA